MATQRGLFIVIEGIDASGKSTQCKRLADFLMVSCTKCTQLSFPDRSTPVGKFLDDYLRGESSDSSNLLVHKLFSANRFEVEKSLKKTLEDGVTVICDRYVYSGAAYSMAKGKGMTYQRCKSEDAGLPKPDLIIYLNVPPEKSHARDSYGTERYETMAFQRCVYEAYREIIEKEQGKTNFVEIDGTRSKMEVESDIVHAVCKLLNEKRKDLGVLVA